MDQLPHFRSVVVSFAAVVLVWLTAAIVRRIATRSALRRRQSVVVLPTLTFDAQPGTVGRVGSELAQACRRLVGGWWTRRACALRVSIEPTTEGELLYGWEGPEHAGEVLEVPRYDETETRRGDSPEVLEWKGQLL